MDRRRSTPGSGQESVWDYPRPPRVEPSSRNIRVVFNDTNIAELFFKLPGLFETYQFSKYKLH